MPIAGSESDDPETSMSKYFSESTARSESLTSTYGSDLAGAILSDKAYVVKSNDALNKEGVLVQIGDNKYVYKYIISSGDLISIELTGNNVKIDESGNVKIEWNGYYIKDNGTIELTSNIEDVNAISGDKTFMTITENNVEKMYTQLLKKVIGFRLRLKIIMLNI